MLLIKNKPITIFSSIITNSIMKVPECMFTLISSQFYWSYNHFSVAKIVNIEPLSTSFNLRVKVLESEVILDKERLDGSRARAAEALVGDETGTIIFSAWGGMWLHFN